jgi:hypothetical protein
VKHPSTICFNKKTTSIDVMLSPPSSGRCCDAGHASGVTMLTFVLAKIEGDYFILKLFQTSSILPLQAAKASQHRPDEGGLSITLR